VALCKKAPSINAQLSAAITTIFQLHWSTDKIDRFGSVIRVPGLPNKPVKETQRVVKESVFG